MIRNNLDNADNTKFLKIYSSDDLIMQKVGQILSTQTSRRIYVLLTNHELNATEIGKKLSNDQITKMPNLIFHLNKMVEVGLLKISKRSQKFGGHRLTYYKALPLILIVPPHYFEKAYKSKTLQTTLDKIFKIK